jgi:ABC-type dipeptide/oligopeptide/nickel transport system ATPase component
MLNEAETPLLLEFENLTVRFPMGRADWFTAVDGINLSMRKNESHGLVGESGSGKTVSALAAIGLLDPTAQATGCVRWEGRSLDPALPKSWNSIRGSGVTMMFQDAKASLNPSRKVGKQLESVLRLHGWNTAGAVASESERLLRMVRLGDLGEKVLQSYPSELSGGMAQRVALALALACHPKLLIADEPTAALDATVAVSIVALLRDIQKEVGLAMLIISHDMNVVKNLCDQISVMKDGQVVETGAVHDVFQCPKNPHTQKLISAARWDLSGSSAAIRINENREQ